MVDLLFATVFITGFFPQITSDNYKISDEMILDQLEAIQNTQLGGGLHGWSGFFREGRHLQGA